MARREWITLVCDLCGKENDTVETHTLDVDGTAREAEACLACWVKVTKLLEKMYRVGRPVSRPKKRALPKIAAAWPGSKWEFTFHALERLGQRRLQPQLVLEAIEKPEVVFPGRDEGVEVRLGAGLKVAVNPEERVVLTASSRVET
jgi:hypothetical protein